MASAGSVSEKETLLASLDLPHMRGVGEALVKVGLKELKEAAPEDQKRMVKAALDEALRGYQALENYPKLPLVERTKELYDQGLLTLPDLLQGLGLKAPTESGKKGFLDRIRSSLQL